MRTSGAHLRYIVIGFATVMCVALAAPDVQAAINPNEFKWLLKIPVLRELAELSLFIFILKYISAVSWTKMTFGGFLACVGALYPKFGSGKESTGEANIRISKVSILLKGGIRYCVVVCGVVLVIFSAIEGYVSTAKLG